MTQIPVELQPANTAAPGTLPPSPAAVAKGTPPVSIEQLAQAIKTNLGAIDKGQVQPSTGTLKMWLHPDPSLQRVLEACGGTLVIEVRELPTQLADLVAEDMGRTEGDAQEAFWSPGS